MDVLIHKKYPDELQRYLFKIYQEKTLCDTIIHTPDGGAFQAHKIIVTASSTYLHNILSQSTQIHSTFSVDVRSEILQVLLEFMYTGQLFVSELTRDEVSQAATYLQIYPIIDLLKETSPEKEFENAENSSLKPANYSKSIEELSGNNEYDSDNTIVDDSDLIAAFNSISKENLESKDRKKHPRKQSLTAIRKSGDLDVSDFTAIKQEKFDHEYERSKKVDKVDIETHSGVDPDYIPEPETKSKSVKKSQNNSKAKRKSLSTNSEKDVSPKAAKIQQSKPEKKTHSKVASKPMPKIQLKKSRGKGSIKKSVKKSKSQEKLKSKVTLPAPIPRPAKKTIVKKEKISEETKSKTVTKPRKVYKPNKDGKCACKFCNKKFPAFVFLRKHLLVRHKEKFADEWGFSRYLLKHYSGSSKYIESCSVDISGKKNVYKCSKCKRTFNRYSLHRLHFKRDHLMKKVKVHGQFSIISKRLKKLENLLQGILQKSNLKIKTESTEGSERAFGPKPKKIKTAECDICNKMFVNEFTLKIHRKNMHGIEPERKYRTGVAEERRARESTKLFQCADCEKFMTSQYSLQKHIKDAHKCDDETARHRAYEVPYELKCEVISCDYTTSNLQFMKNHVLYSHPFIQHPCSECKMVFQVRLMLERHKFYKHAFKPPCNYMCAHCDKRFPKQFRLKVHEFYKHGIEHEDIKIYHCDAPGCTYVTASQSSLRVHGSKHVKDKPFTCEFCGMKLKTPLSHQKHINKMHLGIRPYLCQICGQSFGEDHELKSHIRNKHTAECDFQCEHCPYATTNKGTFYTHLYNVHKVRADDDKREEFVCPHPGCTFVSILHHRFQTHLNGHTNTRTYCCKPCNKWFVSSSTLRAHKQWYHSDKLHSCTQCNYQTKTSQKLNEHVRVQHQLKGLKPFKCPYCEFRCATGGNTRKHVKQVHRGRVVTYLRDDQILNAAKVARASGQNQPLINIMPPEALNASIPCNYPASAKKLGIIADNDEQMKKIVEQSEPQMGLTKVEEEPNHVSANQIAGSVDQILSVPANQISASGDQIIVSATANQIPEPSNQMILSSDHLVQVSEVRTEAPLELGAQVTVGLHNQIQVDLRNHLQTDLRPIQGDMRNQITADHLPAELRSQLSTEHTMPLVSSGHHIPFSAGHYITTGSGTHHIPLSGGLMPMMMAPHVAVSAGSYEDVKDNVAISNLTMI